MSKKQRQRSNAVAPKAAAPLSNSRKLILGLILGATFLTYFNSMWNGWAYDDNSFILENHLVRSFTNIPTVFTHELWFYRVLQDRDPEKDQGPTTAYYRPMFSVFHMVCWAMFGDRLPGGWHFMNILVHLAVVYFAFLILEKITGDLRLTAVATLLFAIHPLRSESVAWICGISDPFLALFLFPSFYLYMKFREGGERKHLIGSLALFLFAAFSKEPAVALAIFVLAYELFIINQDQPWRERLRLGMGYGAAYFLVSVIYFSMRYYALGFVLHDEKFASYTNLQVLLTIPIVFWKYILLQIWPFSLSLFHETPIVTSPLSWRFLAPAAAGLGLAAALWPLRHSMLARFAILWYAVNILPVLNLKAFAVEFLVQERYVYIPSLGFSLLVAMGLMKLPIERWIGAGRPRLARVGLIAALVVLLAGKSVAQNRVWADDETLWRHGVKAAPEQAMSHYVLGRHYMKTRQPMELIEAFENYLRLRPDNIYAYGNLAAAYLLAYEQTGYRDYVDRSIELAEQGLNINQNHGGLWDTLAYAHMLPTHHQNPDRARAFMNRALKLQPDNPIFHLRMASLFASIGQHESAFPYLDTARRLLIEQQQTPPPDLFKLLSYSYENRGQYKEAVESLNAYLQMNPNGRDSDKERQRIESLRNLAQAANKPAGE